MKNRKGKKIIYLLLALVLLLSVIFVGKSLRKNRFGGFAFEIPGMQAQISSIRGSSFHGDGVDAYLYQPTEKEWEMFFSHIEEPALLEKNPRVKNRVEDMLSFQGVSKEIIDYYKEMDHVTYVMKDRSPKGIEYEFFNSDVFLIDKDKGLLLFITWDI